MNTEDWLKQLELEGFTDLRVCPLPPAGSPEHTHDVQTVHVILRGNLTISDAVGTRMYRPGERVDFPAHTTHVASGSLVDGEMIVGVRVGD